MKIVIDLPDNLGAEILKNAATVRKSNRRDQISKGANIESISTDLPDDQYIIAEIKSSLIADHIKVVRLTAGQQAAKKAAADEIAKISAAEQPADQA